MYRLKFRTNDGYDYIVSDNLQVLTELKQRIYIISCINKWEAVEIEKLVGMTDGQKWEEV